MPGLNRKGPNGEGAMTGRRMGLCSSDYKGKSVEEILQDRIANNQSNEQEVRGMGRGLGLGRRGGAGRGFGRGYVK